MVRPVLSGSQASIRRRLDRLSKRRIQSGMQSVGDVAALSSVGFRQVSEVIGAVANSVTPQGFYAAAPPMGRTASGSAGYRDAEYRGPAGNRYLTMPTYTSSTAPVSVGTPPTITALKAGYRTALSRLVAEATAVGADGVVGVQLNRTVSQYGGAELWTFLAIGTAIRSVGFAHTEHPFTTDLSGAQVAAGMRNGWIPLTMLIVPCMAIKWIDLASRYQNRRLAPNGEVAALTDLINTCRHQARQDFARSARNAHADAAVLTDMTLSMHHSGAEPVATATVTVSGTALGQFRTRSDNPRSLTIMPLTKGRTGP
jgi:uncharacterized protein YbjQ (UPF0145 family)